ncbi:MAG: hypothetical protein BWY72_01381 [Bacteroidetes bacterium ADurb.Bin416]|nr:MAG: hypothetical protein BWY72_01381 [Bacteroidetes bacterium ADurb.Bin416]
MTFTLRKDTVSTQIQQVPERKVSKFQADGTHDTSGTITGGKFNLVVGTRGQVEVNVNGTGFFIGDGTDSLTHFFLVKMPHLSQFTDGSFQVGHTEQSAGLHAEFPTDDVFVHPVVTADGDAVDGGGSPLTNAHFQVNGVSVYRNFHRIHLEKEVAVVLVQVGNGIISFGGPQAFVEMGLVVHIPPLDHQHVAQLLGGVDRVADPADVAVVVLLAFTDTKVHIHGLVVETIDGIFNDGGIPVPIFVVFIQESNLVIEVFFLDKLFGSEEVFQLTLLIGFFHSPVELGIGQRVVAVKNKLVDFDLVFAVNVDIDNHLSGAAIVFGLDQFHVCILETLFIKISLDQGLCSIGHVWGYLVSNHEANLVFQLFAV